jgi:EpsI family protein
MPDRRQLLIGGALLGASALGFALTPRRVTAEPARGALEKAIPQTIGSYSVSRANKLVVPPESDLSQRLYDQVLTRLYVSEDLPPILLVIAYGSVQDSALALHRPEICYSWAGYWVGKPQVLAFHRALQNARASYLSVVRGDRTEQVYFWSRVGNTYPTSLVSERLAIIEENLKGVLPDGILVRLSMLSNDAAAALPLLADFNSAMLEQLGESGRAMLLGEPIR